MSAVTLVRFDTMKYDTIRYCATKSQLSQTHEAEAKVSNHR